MIKPAYSVSFLLSINIFVWQNVLYFPNDVYNKIMKYFGVRVAFYSILTRLQAEWPVIQIPIGTRDFLNF